MMKACRIIFFSSLPAKPSNEQHRFSAFPLPSAEQFCRFSRPGYQRHKSDRATKANIPHCLV